MAEVKAGGCQGLFRKINLRTMTQKMMPRPRVMRMPGVIRFVACIAAKGRPIQQNGFDSALKA